VPQIWSESCREEKKFYSAGNRTGAVQPVARRYTELSRLPVTYVHYTYTSSLNYNTCMYSLRNIYRSRLSVQVRAACNRVYKTGCIILEVGFILC
jgi:hypothetical protein